MVYTYDEIIAVLQTEGDLLEEKKQANKEERFKQRFQGIYKDSEFRDKKGEEQQRQKLEQMTPEQFERKRLEQAMQLYSAYKSDSTPVALTPGGNFSQRNRTVKTDITSVRSVTGKFASRRIYNTDILYLDSKTISGIEALAWAEGQMDPEKRIKIEKVSPVQLLDVVDDLVAAREIIAKDYTPKGQISPSDRILATETNLVKRSIGFKKNQNVYGIEDYSVNVEQMLDNKTNLMKKAYRYLKTKFQELKSPKQNQDRFGDKKIYLDDGERG